MKLKLLSITAAFFILCSCALTAIKGRKVGTFLQEVRTFYNQADGLPANNVNAIAITANGDIYAGTNAGLAVFAGKKWRTIKSMGKMPVWMLAANGNTIAAFTGRSEGKTVKGGAIYILNSKGVQHKLRVPEKYEVPITIHGLALADKIFLGVSGDLLVFDPVAADKAEPANAHSLKFPAAEVRQIAISKNGELFAAANSALLCYDPVKAEWLPLYPHAGIRSWAPIDVRGVAIDRGNRLWFATHQGVGCRAEKWSLYTGQEGLPYNDFTVVAAGENGVAWFGTHKGAIRFDGTTWEYRQGMRWLPNDDVRDIAVSPEGNAWFATKKGVALIERKAMTLAEKARWYEAEIDRYHRRTPYEYVLEVSLKAPGDKSEWRQHDSDNDGLWTSMYGAGECFAYAATKDPNAKTRAKKAFEALRFLGEVTQRGSNPAPTGFIARTILPTDGFNPNTGRIERDRQKQREQDRLWKVYEPRWPISADGKWYWKSDTSSDELDGHYFFYALYYDLVAETKAEKTRVREHVQALTDHLIKHDFQLMDHDGRPTRWARFNPDELNFDQRWFMERGLNSLSMLSYLAVTEHITGDPKYRLIADSLIEKHSYLQNMMNMKFQRGLGTGNQSDDEMAFMCYYNLIKYEKNPERRLKYAISFWLSWRLEQPEMNPFFNFAFAASCAELSFTDPWGTYSTAPTGDWLEDAIETLKRFPLDRINWRHENSHRIDIVRLPEVSRLYDEDEEAFAGRGYRNNGKVIPIDECYFNHWNRNPWDLDTGGNGLGMGDGAVFLLPYYMGLYHGLIVE